MLALPLVGQFEQVFNARLLERVGYGQLLSDVEDDRCVARFIERVDGFAGALAGYVQAGNQAVLAAVDAFIARHQ